MNNEVIPYLQEVTESGQTEFLRKLEAQLAKDLYPAEWGEISKEPTPQALVNQLQQVVSILIQKHGSALGQVLYRIDIPEGKIRSLMAATPADERASILAAQILEREAKKVWLRMQFSQNS
jgi:hypothetical protein